MIIRAYKVELNPNNKQISFFNKCIGSSRYIWNWALAKKLEIYRKDKKQISAFILCKEIVKLKETDLKWLYEISYTIIQDSLGDLDNSFKNFFRKVKQKKSVNFPKFKSKKNERRSFKFRRNIHIREDKIKLPKIGWIKLKEKNYIPINSKILFVTVSNRIDRWFISVSVEEDIEIIKSLSTQVIGIDLGIKDLAICSNGMKFGNPKILKKYEKKLIRTQKSLSRKKKGSSNRKKTKLKLSKLHCKISNIRNNYHHEISTSLARIKPKVIVVENLKVENMLKNRCLSKSISDCGWSSLVEKLRYKCFWNGIEFIQADTYYPSTKLCSICDYKTMILH